MITVIYDDKFLALSVDGHAGYAPKGQDIICSSVSILTLTLATYVKKSEEMLEDVTLELEDGSSYIQITPKKDYHEGCKAVFDAICEGYKLLAKNEPKYVEYISREDLI